MNNDFTYLGLGANLPSRFGEPSDTLKAAIVALSRVGLTLKAQSPVYKTAPVPISTDPWFYNQVVAVTTALEPSELLTLINSIEAEFGRVRTVQNAPRIIDIDILAFGAEVIDTATLQIPHPRLIERAFVLFPLLDIAPTWTHPVSGRSVEELIADLPGEQAIEKVHE